MSIKSIISLTEVEKPIYNLLVEQSQLPPDKVRDATSLYGSGLYEILNNGETISGLNHSDALLLFALHTVDNESDISQTFENNQINYYKAFELEITIYGDIAADYAFPLAARLRTSAVRQSTFDKGIYIRTVENPVEVHEFVSGTVWTQYNFKVNIGVRFNIEPVTNDYSIEEKGEVKIMHTSDWARMLYPARAESPVEIRESANGIELVYANNDVVLIPFEFGAGIIAQVKNAEKGKKLLITAPGGGGSHEGGRAFDIAEDLTADVESVLLTAITVPPGLQVAVGDMLFGVNGGRALIINIPEGGTTADVQFLGINAPAREVVRFNVPVSAMNGTLTETELATLQDNEANYIEFNHENYYLADAQHEAGFLVYSHTGHDNQNHFFVKCITITISTRGWVLNSQKLFPLPSGGITGQFLVSNGTGGAEWLSYPPKVVGFTGLSNGADPTPELVYTDDIKDVAKFTTTTSGNAVNVHNDLDNYFPFNAIEEFTDAEGNAFVKFPKMWIKWVTTDDGTIDGIKISDGPVGVDYFIPDCFLDPKDSTCSTYLPYFAIGKYEASGTNEKMYSHSGQECLVNVTRAQSRAAARSYGSSSNYYNGYQQIDFSMFVIYNFLCMMYFKTPNIQRVYPGRTSASNAANTGSCDILTGMNGWNTDTQCVKMLGVENPYGNIFKWIDGINFNDTIINAQRLPQTYNDVGGVNIGIERVAENGWITKAKAGLGFGKSYVYAFAVDGSADTYYGDNSYYSSNGTVLSAGGNWNLGASAGLWYLGGRVGSSVSYSDVGGRLSFRPL